MINQKPLHEVMGIGPDENGWTRIPGVHAMISHLQRQGCDITLKGEATGTERTVSRMRMTVDHPNWAEAFHAEGPTMMLDQYLEAAVRNAHNHADGDVSWTHEHDPGDPTRKEAVGFEHDHDGSAPMHTHIHLEDGDKYIIVDGKIVSHQTTPGNYDRIRRRAAEMRIRGGADYQWTALASDSVESVAIIRAANFMSYEEAQRIIAGRSGGETVKLCQLPSIVRSDFYSRVVDLVPASDRVLVGQIMNAFNEAVEDRAHRLGVFCPVDGCNQVCRNGKAEGQGGVNVRLWDECPEHGDVGNGPKRLAVAFYPLREDPPEVQQ